MKADNSWLRVAYSGTFQVDAETADVARMTITTGDVPPATGLCRSTTMDLTREHIGGGQFLVSRPQQYSLVYPNPSYTLLHSPHPPSLHSQSLSPTTLT